MFDKQYRFKGSHAVRVTKLTSMCFTLRSAEEKQQRNVRAGGRNKISD